MRKICFLLFYAMCITSFIKTSAQTITIGSGTSSNYYVPMSRLFEYSATEVIYTSSEIGITGSINSVGWNILSNAYSVTTGNAKIYMKMTSQNTTTSPLSLAGYTLVYQGNIDNNVLGWQSITLTTPFNYSDSTQNLSVFVVHASGNYTLSPPNYAYTSITGRSSRYYSTSTAWNETKTMSATGERADIRLNFGTLGVSEITKEKNFKYYPSSVKDVFNVSSTNTIKSIEIYSVLGTKIVEEKLNDKEIKMNLSNLKAGVYIVKINFNNKTETAKIIKE